MASASASTSNSPPLGSSEVIKLNESLYELYRPVGNPEIEVVFFHGLQLGSYKDAYLTTWMSADGSNKCWLNTWLAEEVPRARILSVSYDSSVLQTAEHGHMDLYLTGESLVNSVIQLGKIGQRCPVVLIGHSVGGLVVKQICLSAKHLKSFSKDPAQVVLNKFLKNLKGMFFFATPCHGSRLGGNGSMLGQVAAIFLRGPLLEYMEMLNKYTSRLNHDFSKLQRKCNWRTVGVGESNPTTIMRMPCMVVEEASARAGIDNFFMLSGSDHFNICRPSGKTCNGFQKVTQFVDEIIKQTEPVVLGHQCHGLPYYAVTLDESARKVEEKLNHAPILGIFGMGGIGKTTIAKKVFNNVSGGFDYTCFVDNVKGIPTHELQAQVLTQWYQDGNPINQRVGWSHLKEKKILIVMDDVDSEEQLKILPSFDHFKSGSKLIFTTRDQGIFRMFDDTYAPYEVDFLPRGEAKKLFCNHAFKVDEIPKSLSKVQQMNVQRVVKKCDGLPLTLEVMGRYLRGHENDEEFWEDTIDKLGKAQAIDGGNDDRVWAKLSVSLNALQTEEREMFVEAATFFFEQPLEKALAAWSTTSKNSKTRWENLVNRCLVKEVDNARFNSVFRRYIPYKEVWVHQQLRDLGQTLLGAKMVCGSNESAVRSTELFNAKKVKVDVQILRLLHDGKQDYDKQEEARRVLLLGPLGEMYQLKYIDLRGIFHKGSCSNFSRKLSLLRWSTKEYSVFGAFFESVPLFPISLEGMENLAVLELNGWRITKGFQEALGKLTNLRILSLSHVKPLNRLSEEFGSLSQLRRLELTNVNLRDLPRSFGSLRSLKHLSFVCAEFVDLPESFGDLSSLVTLEFYRCVRLANLPESFGRNLRSLKELIIKMCPLLKRLPHSFSRLSGLQRLRVNNESRLEELGGSFGDLSALKNLSLDNICVESLPPLSVGFLCSLEVLKLADREPGKLESLPDNFGQLTALRSLDLEVSKMQSFPDSFCLLASLKDLTIKAPKLAKLPENLGHLASLQNLVIRCERLAAFPESLRQLVSLRALTMECDNVKKLPDSLGQLSSLETITISKGRRESLPNSFGGLSSLRKLNLQDADSSTRLPKSFGQLSSLEDLEIRARNLESLPESFGGISSLRKLNLRDADSLTRLSESFGQLSSLEDLDIRARNLESLPESFGGLSSLRKLNLRDADSLTRLPESFGQLSSLEDLEIRARNLESLPESFGGLSSLRTLDLQFAHSLMRLPESFGQLSSLEDLEIRARNLESLPESFGGLSSLRKLNLWDADSLMRLPESFGQLSLLNDFELEAKNLQSLPDSFGVLSSLRELTLLDVDSLRGLPESFGQLSSLKSLNIRGNSLESLPESFGRLSALQTLQLGPVQSLRKLPECTMQLPSLQAFQFGCDGHERLPEHFEKLSSCASHLILKGPGIAPQGLGNLTSLEDLTLEYFDVSRSDELWKELGMLSSLRRLTIDGGSGVQSLSDALGSLSVLQDLKLRFLFALEILPEAIGRLSSLQRLRINGCPKLECLPESLGRISSLTQVDLRKCISLKGLPDSLGKPSLPQTALWQDERVGEPSRSSEEYPAVTTPTGEVKLSVKRCSFLDESSLGRLGWVCVSREGWTKYYKREGPGEENIPAAGS